MNAISREQIEALSNKERRALARQLVTAGRSTRFDISRFRRRRLVLAVGAVLVLIPWTAHLGPSLPSHYTVVHWRLAWIGFDCILTALFAASALLGIYGRHIVVLTSFAAGVLLLCDGWFDITTADSHDLPYSVALAVLIEGPLAVLLISGSLRLMRTTLVGLHLIDPDQPLLDAPLLPLLWSRSAHIC